MNENKFTENCKFSFCCYCITTEMCKRCFQHEGLHSNLIIKGDNAMIF